MSDKRNTTTPRAASMIALLGGSTFEGLQFSVSECEDLERFYGFSKSAREQAVEASRALHAARKVAVEAENQNKKSWEHKVPDPGPFDEKNVRAFLAAGDGRNMFRHAQNDGLRLMAFLARFVEPGLDPLKTLVQLVSDAGWDVDPEDVEWAFDEMEDDE